MSIPAEPIGRIPRPADLLAAIDAHGGNAQDPALEPLYEAAVRDTIRQFEATGSPVITDGEQRKYHNFWTYSVHGSCNTSPDGFKIPFGAGHTRRMPRLIGKPFGTTDDCGFAPFCDDTSTTRETAFAKIRSRVQGTALAAQELGLSNVF